MKSPTYCLPFQGEPLKAILDQIPKEAENVVLCGQGAPSQGSLVAWVYNPDVVGGWTDTGTYLGQEEDQAPTITLSRGGHTIRLRFASTWFDQTVTPDQAQGAFERADALVQRKFRVKGANWASPVALGRHLMAASWSRDGIKVPPAPPEVRELLQAIGPQGRHECLMLPDLETIPALYGYDMRLAYLWCCKGLPYGPVIAGRAGPGAHKICVKWEAEGWGHVGLLPMRQQGWRYPLLGEGWIDGREYDLADRNAWHLEVTGGLGWDSVGALDRWSDGLQWCLRQSKEDRIVYRLFRRVALNTIGSLHRSSKRVTRALPVSGREMPPAGNPSLRLSDDGTVYHWQEEKPLSGRALLYCHPEWTTTIWARCRARLAQAALQFPREQVVAMRQDALFVTHRGDFNDDGAIGRFRLKEEVPGPLPAPHTLEELQELRGAIQ